MERPEPKLDQPQHVPVDPQPRLRGRGAGVDESGDEEFEPGRRNQRFPFEELESNTSLIFVEEPVVTRFIAHWSRRLLLFVAGLTIGFLAFKG